MDENTKIGQESLPKLEIQVRGPSADQGKLSVTVLIEIISHTQKAINQIMQNQLEASGEIVNQNLNESCPLLMVDWKKGSAISVLEVGMIRENTLFPIDGKRSVQTLIQGVKDLSEENDIGLPVAFDKKTLDNLFKMGTCFANGVDSITLQLSDSKHIEVATYNSTVREKVKRLKDEITSVTEPQNSEKFGLLKMLDGRRKLKGILCDIDGNFWQCQFQEKHNEILKGAWMNKVKLQGLVQGPKIDVQSIHVLQDEALSNFGQSFWQPQSIEHLAQEQGIKPISSLNEIRSMNLEDSEADALIEEIQKERALRRKGLS